MKTRPFKSTCLLLAVSSVLTVALTSMHPHFSPAQMRQRIREITTIMALKPPAEAREKALLLEEKGQLLNETDRFGQAVLAFEKALVLAPRDHRLRYNMANIFLLREMTGQAISCLEAAIVRAPGELTYQVQLARALYQAGRFTDAAGVWQAAGMIDSLPMGKAEKFAEAAACLIKAGKSTAARKAWDLAIKATPNDPTALAERGLFLLKLDEPAAAAADLARAITAARQKHEIFTWQVKRGQALARAGKTTAAKTAMTEALETINALLAEDPTYPEVLYFEKAQALHVLGHPKKAAKNLTAALKILPGDPQFLELGTRLYPAAGLSDQAKKCQQEIALDKKRNLQMDREDQEFLAQQKEQTQRQWRRGRLLKSINLNLAAGRPIDKDLDKLTPLGEEGKTLALRWQVRQHLANKKPEKALALLATLPDQTRKIEPWAALLKLAALAAAGRKAEGKSEQALLAGYMESAKK